VDRVAKTGRRSAWSEVSGHRFEPAERIADDLCQLGQLRVGEIDRPRRPVPEAAVPLGIGEIRDGQLVW
jgi:hypothetical protein